MPNQSRQPSEYARIAQGQKCVAIGPLINFVVTITLIEMMVAIGLSVTVANLAIVARDLKLIVCAVLSNYLCVLAAAVLLLRMLDPHPMVAAGFLVLSVCPGAPYGPPLTAVARGSVPVAVGLMVLLAGSSAIVAPIALRVLLPLVSGSDPQFIDFGRIVITLLLTQMLPLCLGIAVRHCSPTVADRLQTPATLVSKVLNLLTVGLILVAQFGMVSEIRLRGFVGTVALLIISWMAGWLFGGPKLEDRKALAVTTSLRNFGVGLVIVTSTFPGTPAVTSVIAYGLISLLGAFALATIVGYRERSMRTR
jgi:BASS family bile acid:Na+ symporter